MTQIEGLRLATPDDAPALAKLINLAFQVERSFKIGDRTDPQQVRERFGAGSFYIVERNEGAIGCVYIDVARSGLGGTGAIGAGAGYIGMLAVHPAQQGKGLGRQLMSFAESELRSRGCTRLQLRIVSLRPELLDFYHRQGYRETGTTTYPFPEKVSQPIHFVNMEKPSNGT